MKIKGYTIRSGDGVGQDSFNWRAWRNHISSTNNFENTTDSKRWLDFPQPWFSSRWQSQATAWPSSLQSSVIVAWHMLISCYQILIALGTRNNAAISAVLRFQYVGVIATINKARLLLFTSQVMAAFRSAMFDNRQVWPSVSCSNHSLLSYDILSYFGHEQNYF